VRQVNAQTFEYRMHVVRQKDTVFFAIGWQIRGLGTMDDLDRALAALTISPDAGAPAPEEFSDLQKKWHATFLNGIGLHEYNRNQFAWAEPYFRRAAQL